ncbi:MAG: hypothetical protein HY893_09020 [Deltaproteobacteria bacterium]|nr:hypothetical protein [Deltaproteobacteria bacterium]
MDDGPKKEFTDIVDGLKRNLEFMRASGITEIPAAPLPAKGPPSGDAGAWVSSIGLPEIKEGYSGVAFSAWRLGKALFIEGSELSSGVNGPLKVEAAAQVERLLGWVGQELGVKPTGQPFSCYSVREGGGEDLGKGVEKAALLMKGHIGIVSPSVIVALGTLASRLLLGRADVEGVIGRFQSLDGAKVMPTHDSSSLVRDPALKKETMAHMLVVIKLLKE